MATRKEKSLKAKEARKKVQNEKVIFLFYNGKTLSHILAPKVQENIEN